MSTDIKELQELIEQERSAEQEVKRAKEEAQNIVEVAREKAESTIQGIDADPSWEKLRRARKEETAGRKAQMDEDYKRKAALLERTAHKNFEKAVAYVIKETLRVEI